MYIPCFVAKLTPWWGVALYLAFGVAWVFAGDALLAQWAGPPEQIAHFQTWKGWAYVLLTSPLTGWLLNPMIASVAMSLSSLTVILNSLRLRWFK